MSKTLRSLVGKSFFIPFLVLQIFLLTSCSPVTKMIRNGDYKNAFSALADELSEKSTPKKIEQFKEVYTLANKQDLDEIQSLRASGQPDIWQKVHFHYFALNARQATVSKLPPEILQSINYKATDYSEELESARQKAAAYYYAMAMKCLADSNYLASPSAYDYFLAAHNVYPGFRDVEKRMAEYKSNEPKFINYQFENLFPNSLPPGSIQFLENLDLSLFNTPKYYFVHETPNSDRADVFVRLSLTRVKISPERTGELAYTESAKMQDGIAYALNDDGDFKLDSLDRKIQIPKFNTLVCYVTEYKQEKSMLLLGKIEVIDRSSGKTIAVKSVKGVSDFENRYAKFKGDMDALSPETFELLGTKEREFPDDAVMIKHAGEKFAKDAAEKVIEVLDNVQH